MSSDSPPNLTMRTVILLGVILIVGATLRFWNIGRNSFWLDEFITVALSNGHGLNYMDMQGQNLMSSPPDYVHLDRANSWTSIWSESNKDVHPPLFYVILRAWRMVVPDTDAWIRALSALFSLVAIVLLFFAVSTFGGTTTGLWAALLMALAGPQIEYSQENRSYMLLLATLLGAAVTVLRIERFGLTPLRAVVLGLYALAAALTHYAALPMLGAIGFYALLRLRGPALKGAMTALLVAAVLFAAIWGPFALAQFKDFSQHVRYTEADPSSPRWKILLTLTLLPLRYFSTTGMQTTAVGHLGAAIFLLPALLLRRRPELLFWWLWLIVGVGAVLVSDLLRNGQTLYWIRYTLAASPGAYALAAMMLSHMSGYLRHIVPMTLAISSIAALEGAYDPGKPEWREMGRYIDAHFLPGDVLIIGDLDAERWPARSDMVSLNFYTHTTPIATAIMTDPPSPPLRQQLMSAKRIWIFTNGMRSAAGKLFPALPVRESKFIPGVGTMVRVDIPKPIELPAIVPPSTQLSPTTPR